MDLHTLALLVKSCRDAQKKYFRDRTPMLLNESKDWERRLDKAVSDVLDPPTAGLFDNSSAGEKS